MAKKFRDADKELKKAGFKPARQNGSHITYKDSSGKTVVVPKHGEIKTGTWSGIEKQAGLKKPKQAPTQDAQAAQRAAGSGMTPPGKKARGSGQQGQGQGQGQGQAKPKRRLFGGRDGR